MDRFAAFVDAGYVFAGGSLLLTGRVLKRGELVLDPDAFLSLLCDKASALTGLPLLRTYWYDGTAGPPTPFQQSVAYRSDVKLRLGLVNPQGIQKGVDSLIVTDLINLARNRAMASAVVVTGDDDIRVGVQQAQEYGVRVHLIGITPSLGSGVSGLMQQEADTFTLISDSEVRGFLRAEQRVATLDVPAAGDSAPEDDDIENEIVRSLILQLSAADIALVAEGRAGMISAPVDRQLLAVASKRLGSVVPDEIRKRLRHALSKLCRERVAREG